MNTENRDFVIERLERQLKEKETELDDIKTNLRESILREIRSDLKNDLDFNNRITQLEHKFQSLSSNLNGIMDELLDQKSMIRSLKDQYVSNKNKVETKVTPKVEKSISEEPAADVPSPIASPGASPRVYRPEPRPLASSTSDSQVDDVSPSSKTPLKHTVPKESVSHPSQSNPKVTIRSAEPEPVSRKFRPPLYHPIKVLM